MSRAPRHCFAALCLALVAAGPVPAARSAERIYWPNAKASKISFARLDGGEGGDLNTTGATVEEPEGTALDPAAGRIYWASASGNTISYARLDGSGGGDLNTGSATLDRPEGVAIDPAGRRIYWANAVGNRISFARLDGSGGGDLDTGGATVSGPGGLAVDSESGRLYWANAVGNKISYARLEGGQGGDLNTGTAIPDVPEGVAIDPATRTIYWANLFAGDIMFARLDGSGGGELATGAATVSEPAGMAIDPVERRIWWTNYGNGADPPPPRDSISFASLDGSGPSGDLDTGTATLKGPVMPSLSRLPAAVAAPVVTGGSTSGSVLSCSNGSWAGDVVESFLYRAPVSYGYAWSRDDTDIPGAAGSSYAATGPGTYRCRVIAANDAGERAQVSEPRVISAPPTPPPPPPAVPARPAITGLAITPRSFSAARSGPSAVAARGATVRFRLNVAASVRFTVRRRLTGRRAARGKCSKPTRANRRARRCIRRVGVRGSFTRAARAGAGSFRFTGRLRGRRLAAGSYELVATPSSAGRRGAARRIRFAITLR